MNEQAIEWSTRIAVEKCFSDVWWRFISADCGRQQKDSGDRKWLGVTKIGPETTCPVGDPQYISSLLYRLFWLG